MTRPNAPAQAQRGFAMIAVLGAVVLLTIIVALTIQISSHERGQAGKQVHNQSLSTATESALQYAKNYFLAKYPGGGWDTYLSWFVDHPATLDTTANVAATMTAVAAFDAGLKVNYGGFDCFVYARDDMDELDTTNNARHDNNQLIFVGAVCAGTSPANGLPLIAELSAPLVFIAPGKY